MGLSRREQHIRDRQICLLYYMEHFSVDELAKSFSMTTQNVRNIVKKGKLGR